MCSGGGWGEVWGQAAGPGVDGVPISDVARGLGAGEFVEWEAQFCGVECAAEEFERDWLEPGELLEGFGEMRAGVGPFFLVVGGVNGAEGKSGDGPFGERAAVAGEEFARVFVPVEHDERRADDDAAVGGERFDLVQGKATYLKSCFA